MRQLYAETMGESGTTRLETFSDGVFAIAATLLVLEFSVDSAHAPDLGSALLHLWPSYLAYATSFITIGIIWMNHHTCVETIGRVDRPLLFLNLLLLLTVAFLPFPTRLVADYLQRPGEQSRRLRVRGDVRRDGGRSTTSGGATRRSGRRLIADGVPDSRLRAITRAFNPGVPIYALTLPRRVLQPARERLPDVRDRGVLPAVSCALRARTRARPTPRELVGVARLHDDLDRRAVGPNVG